MSAQTGRPDAGGSPAAIRERGAVGAALLTVRAAAAQVVAFLGTLVLAHQLLPNAFGVVAFGTTVITIGNFFADGGLGASLVRKPTDPTTEELRTLLALQLTVAGVIAAGLVAVGSQAGTAGAVTAVMAVSLPLLALRAPHAIVLERALEYRPIASIEFTESLAYYGWAIATVAIGWGVWGLATAAIVRALAGSVLMTMASPLPMLTPRLTRGTLREMLAFGVGFQAVGLAALARNQGVNLVVAAAGGTQLLGFWSLANRLMQVPFWLFMALWRVSYPTMARLRALGEDTRHTVERLARVTALASGATLAPLAASAHYLIPAMFGARWTSAADPLPWASAGLVVAGPISVAAAGYLYSERDVRTPLSATIVNGAVWVALTAVLLGPMGVAGVGAAWMVASWTEAVMFARALRRRADVAIERFVVVPVGVALVSAVAGYALRPPFTGRLACGIVTAAVALAVYLGLSLVFNRADLLATTRRMRALR
ncbi:MAG TPA: oligosaccharide flippase family protein [Gaiellales bacterium]